MRLLFSILFLLCLKNIVLGQKNEFEELANGYLNQGKFSQAAEFYSKAGYGYWNKNLKTEAAAAFQKAYDLFFKMQNTNGALVTANNLGLIYLDIEEYPKSYTAFQNALKLTYKTNNKTEIFNSLTNVASVALEIHNYNEVIARSNEALQIAKENNSLKQIAKSYSLLAESYEKSGDASNAFKYFELYAAVDKKIKADEIDNIKQLSTDEINRANENKRVTEIELKIKKGELKLTQDSLAVSERLAFERQMQIELRNEQLNKKELQLKYEHQVRKSLIIGIIGVSVFLLLVGLLLFQKLRDNQTLRKQKEEISQQKNKLDIQNKKITDSIQYGLRMQQAMLPKFGKQNDIYKAILIFRPKDIVSGDFYWVYQTQGINQTELFAAVVDCTGHGVPGAFMSMIGHRLLTEIVNEHKIFEPSKVLIEMNQKLRRELDQENTHSTDGMDISFCRITKGKNAMQLKFAGAKRPVYIKHKNEADLLILEPDKHSIGGAKNDNNTIFTDKVTSINPGDRIFLFSDGIIDQNNNKRERFGTPRLQEILNTSDSYSLTELAINLETSFKEHQGVEEQRDDITFLGIELI